MLTPIIILMGILGFQYDIIPEGLYIVSGILTVMAGYFYFLNFKHIATLIDMQVNPNLDHHESIARNLAHGLAVYSLYLNGFVGAAMFILPWMLISLGTDVFAAMIGAGMIEIMPNDEVEEEEEEP